MLANDREKGLKYELGLFNINKGTDSKFFRMLRNSEVI